MKKYINRRFMIISTAAIFMTAVFCTFACYRVFTGEVIDNLRISSRLLSEKKDITEEAVLKRYADELYDDDFRMTLINKEGDVVFDNVAKVEGLENHKNRAEIVEAMEKGEGYSVRRSETINRTNYYYAVRLNDGSILRTARTSHSIINIFWHALPMITVTVLVVLIICYFSSRFLTKSLLEPVETLARNMDHPEQIHTYEELEPIISHIKRQHVDIRNYANIRQEFTANVSHELKTPLAAISGYSELIESGMTGSEDTKTFAREIHKSANRLLALINDILRLSEFDVSEPQDVVMEDVDLYDIALACGDMLEMKAKEHDVRLEIQGEKAMVRANKDMAEEIIYNLCDNAIRYNHPGGYVRVEVKGNRLIVSDNGIGIPKEYHSRIFERFFRVDKSRSKKTGGTGLGLAIVKHIAALLGAKITMDSIPGHGTNIKVTFRSLEQE